MQTRIGNRTRDLSVETARLHCAGVTKNLRFTRTLIILNEKDYGTFFYYNLTSRLYATETRVPSASFLGARDKICDKANESSFTKARLLRNECGLASIDTYIFNSPVHTTFF